LPHRGAAGKVRRAMTDIPSPRIAALYRYPVKGLTGESLGAVDLVPGAGFPDDRRFAIAHGTTAYDHTEPKWLPKAMFLQRARNERLALLEAHYDSASGVLTLSRDGRAVGHARATEPQGRALLGDFLSAFLEGESLGRPRLVEGPPSGFCDMQAPLVSIIGQASIADLSRVVGKPIARARFRANVYLDGIAAWEELSWVGKEISLGGARLKIVQRIGRCAATNVDPATAERDMNLPRALLKGFGHADMGVYGEVIAPGRAALGDWVTI
jgi:uncharacterized protein YcbX